LPTKTPGSWASKGNFDYRYNGQISVDSDHQIIVGQHLSQHANDKQEVAPALENVRAATDDGCRRK
jgi:transposase